MAWLGMTPPQPDAELLAAAARGDAQAFAPLVARHHVAVHRFVARRIGAGDAEDVAAETFEVAYRRAGSYRAEHDDARPWLLGIATNLLRRHARREAAMYRAYAKTGVDPAVPGATEPGVDDATQRALAAALAEMRPDHRNALLLHVLGELSYDEVAEALEVPIGTVKGWLSRARTVAAAQLTAAGITPTEVLS